jgi:hypothetical protein
MVRLRFMNTLGKIYDVSQKLMKKLKKNMAVHRPKT